MAYMQESSPKTDDLAPAMPSTHATKTKYLLVVGFATTLGLFTVLAVMGLAYMYETQSTITTIVETHNVKTRLINEMHNAARERSLTIHTMLDTDDPFERDELFLYFNGLGARFAQARMTLLTMPLSEQEREILNRQGKLTGIALPLQNQIIDLIQQYELARANVVLINEAVPAQDNVMRQLVNLGELQRQAALASAKQSKDKLRTLLRQILTIGGFALVLGVFVSVFITRRISAVEAQLQLEKEFAEITLHSIGDAVITTDRHSAVKYLNPVASKLTGFTTANAAGLPLLRVMNIVHENTHEPAADPILRAIHEQQVIGSTENIMLLNRNGIPFAIEHTAAPIRDSEGHIRGGIVIFRDVTEVRQLADQLSYQASHDTLTNLVNRHEFEIRLNQALAHTRSTNQHHAVLYLDLDQFKIINDTCGHAAGDELLKQIAANLKPKLRENDTFARLGGDEFGVLLEGCLISKARQIAESLRRTIREMRFLWDDKSFEVGVSIGLVPLTSSSGTISEVLSAADTACYEAKDQGRNRIHVFQLDDLNLQKRRGEIQWVHRINDALQQERFVLYFQKIEPVVGDPGSKPFYEILVRMQERGEIIPPMAFIPAAERYGLMPAIDRFVLQKALSTVKQAQQANETLRFSINISGQTLSDTQFLEFAADSIRQSHIRPGTITFEITETAAVANFTRASQFISTLRQLGCRFALDDFGSGLSSFAYLKNIPVHYLKIDGSFVKDIVTDEADFAFVKSIRQIGEVMGISTIAEYVESEQVLQKLGEIGVELAQGFFVGKPMSLNNLQVAHKLPQLRSHNVSAASD